LSPQFGRLRLLAQTAERGTIVPTKTSSTR